MAPVARALVLLLLRTCAGLQLAELECAFVEQLQGLDHHGGLIHQVQRAGPQENTTICHRSSSCYGLWEKRPDGEAQLVKQGCWPHTGSQGECASDLCLVSAPPAAVHNSSYRFCCCRQHLCNLNFTEAATHAASPALRLLEDPGSEAANQPPSRAESALVALVTVAVAAVAIVAVFLGYRIIRGRKKSHSVSVVDLMESNSDAAVELDNLRLLELIGRGRYGTVFRGFLGDRCVAVKLFSSANRQTFANECSIYSLPLLQQHPNVARFLSAEQRSTTDGRPEFLIVMDFYPQGCLSRYLSAHTVDLPTCCRMTLGVTRGLAFLHHELHRGDLYKPAVAHRDVSSRNVLVRDDLTCVLADFGLSMRLTGTRPYCPGGDDDTMAISEVGTVRYMAPEVLGGALNLRDYEAALKQVDVYALGLLLWESFRRCSQLFPGEAAPEYELAFQAELGNHPSFEEMQILVVREKARPRFPEGWEKNSLVLRSLKETMEDCWDQDAEARLTAQCAEERLTELVQLNAQNHRNMSHCSTPNGSASSYIEDHQVGVINWLQGESQQTTDVKTKVNAAEVPEKNRNLINQERQQKQVLNKLRNSCDENMKELSENCFASAQNKTRRLLSHPQSQTAQADKLTSTLVACGGPDFPPLASQPLPKQQNLPLRPTSLHLLSKTKETPIAFPQLKLAKSKYRQVETGVAKLNTVTIISAVEPHLVTTVSNSSMKGGAVGATNLATNGLIAGGQRNLGAVQQLHREDGVASQREDLLSFSPDEQHPLLDREQPPAQSTPTDQCLHQDYSPSAPGSPGSNYNNNNNSNRTAMGLDFQRPGSELHDLSTMHQLTKERCMSSENVATASQPLWPLDGKVLLSSQEENMTSSQIREAQAPPTERQAPPFLGEPRLVSSLVLKEDPNDGSLSREPLPSQTSVPPSAAPHTQGLKSVSLVQEASSHKLASASEASEKLAPEDFFFNWNPNHVTLREPSALQLTALQSPVMVTEAPAILRPQRGMAKAKRPERPSSLDLSSSCIYSDEDPLTGSLSSSGEKIKRRVKTPYTLKKWRPASWVVSAEAAQDLDLEFDHGGQTLVSSGAPVRGSSSLPNQSKSSMAVFLVGVGATATTTSEPDGMTSF